MNKIFRESGLMFDFTASENSYKADEPTYGGLSAVDFIVEMPQVFYFIEVKNLENTPPEYIAEQKEEFLIKIGDKKIQHKISLKFKDTLLKRLAMGERFLKPIVFILLLEYQEFDSHQRRKLFENISNDIPKFSEDKYSSINSISFVLCDKNKYDTAYKPIFAMQG